MTNLGKVEAVAEAQEENAGASRMRRWLKIVGLATAAIFLIGVGVGFLAGHREKGGAMGIVPIAILVTIALALAVSIWLLVRVLRTPTGEEPLTAKERLNRNLLVGSGALGFLLAMLMVLSGDPADLHARILSDSPLPTGIAIVMVLVTGVVVPLLSIYWHRSAVDEQEADAYRTGTLFAFYVYVVGAPAWWFAWRGGFAPEPNGILIFFAVLATAGVIWFWKKHR